MRRGLLFAVIVSSAVPLFAELRSETLGAWDLYTERTRERIEREVDSGEGFLGLDHLEPMERAECESRFERAEVCVLERETRTEDGKEIDVPYGRIHHWYGAVFVPEVGLDAVLEWVTAYDDRADDYEEVEASRLLSREGDEYRIFLRLKREKILSVHFNTEHVVTYERHGEGRASSRSVATRIREIERPGRSDERERPVDQDRGFLWRLDSYWRFEERDGGTLVECESMSLSRSIPAAAAWVVKSFLDSVPRESLEGTLLPIRGHLAPPR